MSTFGIGAYAKGFFGLLRAARMGVGLREGSDIVQPVIDVTNFIGADARQAVFVSNVTPVAAGRTILAGFTVPTGKVWRVICGSCSMANAAASGVNQFGLVIEPPEAANNAGMFATTPSRPLLIAAADNTHVLWEFPGIILESGTIVSLSASGVTVAAGLTANPRLYVEEMPS